MSVLDRISIRGIRNFGVNAEDEQVRKMYMFHGSSKMNADYWHNGWLNNLI